MRVLAFRKRLVHVNMKGDIPAWTAKDLCQIFRQHIFSSSLSAGQKEIFAAEQSLGSLFPDFFSIVYISWSPLAACFSLAIFLPEFHDPFDNPFINVFFP